MINLSVDVSFLDTLSQTLRSEMQKQSAAGAKYIAVATYNKILELVNAQLNSTKNQYLEALSLTQEDENTWFITLDAKAVWIDDGIPENTPMATSSWLLKPGKTKTSKEGFEYRSIPMPAAGKTTASPVNATVAAFQKAVRKELAQRKIPVRRIERDANGKPKAGLLHEFKLKPKGKIGDRPGTDGPAGFTATVRVYQKLIKNKKGKEVAKKSIMTFRTVSSKYANSKWIYPGYTAKHFMDQAFAYGLSLMSKIGEETVEKTEEANS